MAWRNQPDQYPKNPGVAGYGIPPPYMRTGSYYSAQMGTIGANMNLSNAQMWACPFWVPRTVDIDRIGLWVDTGRAQWTAHVGIYRDTQGLPGALLVEGSISVNVATSTTISALTISETLIAQNYYWLAAKGQQNGGAGTAPIVAGLAITSDAVTFPFDLNPSGWNISQGAWQRTGLSAGALPDPFGTPSRAQVAPCVGIRMA